MHLAAVYDHLKNISCQLEYNVNPRPFRLGNVRSKLLLSDLQNHYSYHKTSGEELQSCIISTVAELNEVCL